jgi:hypothetical protein
VLLCHITVVSKCMQALVHCCSTGTRTPTTYSKSTRTTYVRYVIRAQNERTGTLCCQLRVVTTVAVAGCASHRTAGAAAIAFQTAQIVYLVDCAAQYLLAVQCCRHSFKTLGCCSSRTAGQAAATWPMCQQEEAVLLCVRARLFNDGVCSVVHTRLKTQQP